MDLRSLWGVRRRTRRTPLPYGPVFGYTSAFTVFTEFKLLSTLVICTIVYSDSNNLSNLSITEVEKNLLAGVSCSAINKTEFAAFKSG